MIRTNHNQVKQLLLQLDFLQIHYCVQNHWLEASWSGIMDASKTTQGCLSILETLERQPVSKILNCNQNVTGHYPGAVEWVTSQWFQMLYAQGVRQFAWVYSPEFYTQLCTDGMILQQKQVHVQAFYDLAEAKEWLSSTAP